MTDRMDDQNLISKKDLLSKYGISYGALYRWKRKGLIPEEWFIKKSTTTGQETFFPAKLVCERIELIRSQKEDILLDELAHQLNKQEQNNSSLLLLTEFGDKSFRLRDIKSIQFDPGNGQTVDITAAVMAIIEKHENNDKSDTQKEKPTWI